MCCQEQYLHSTLPKTLSHTLLCSENLRFKKFRDFSLLIEVAVLQSRDCNVTKNKLLLKLLKDVLKISKKNSRTSSQSSVWSSFFVNCRSTNHSGQSYIFLKFWKISEITLATEFLWFDEAFNRNKL